MIALGADIQALLDRYLTTFSSRDPAAIAALHSPDSSYWLRLDREPVVGRQQIEEEFARTFAQYPDARCEVREVKIGPSFWVLDWVLDFRGQQSRIRFDCLDVVDVDSDGLVERKITFADLAQAQTGMLTDTRAR